MARTIIRLRNLEMIEAVVCVAVGLLLCVLALVFTAEKHGESREDAVRAAYRVSEKLADSLEAQLRLTLRASELVVARVVHEHAQRDVCGAARSQAPDLRALRELYGSVGFISLTDANGTVLCSTETLSPDAISLEDRDYFRALQNAPADAVAFGAPVRSRIDGNWAIPIARRLERPDGAFRGAVVSSIPIQPLVRTFAAVKPGANGSVTMFDDDKRLVARAPYDEGAIGVVAARAALWTRYPAAMRGQYEAAATATDGVTRIVSFTRVGDYPFVVAVAMSTDDVLADWRRAVASDRLLVGLGCVFVLCASLLLAWRLHILRMTRSAARAARAEAEARSAEVAAQSEVNRRLAIVATATTNAVVIADPQGRIEWVNASFERITGYRLKDACGRKPGDLLVGPKTDRATSAAIREALRARRPIEGVQILNYKKNGEAYWNELEIHPVLGDGGALTAFVALQTDLTERRRTEAEIRELNERISIATAGSGVGIWSLDKRTRTTYLDQTIRELLDLPDDGDTREALAERLSAEDSKRLDERVRALVRTGEELDLQFRIHRRDGNFRYLRAKGAAQRDADGKIVRLLGTAWDVTPQKIVEESLRATMKRAEAANRAKSDFLAMMSHELRTPLNAVIGFAQILEGEYFGPLGDARYKSYAADIRSSGSLLLDLISGILDMNKIERGNVDIHPEALQLADILEDIRPILQEATGRHGHQLKIDVPGDLRAILDPVLIKQLVINLVTNAAKYTKAGGIVELEGRALRAGGVSLAVRDNGFGMKPEEIARATEPFSRFHTATHSNVPGLGLGLAIVKRIADLHQAEIRIESRPNEGTVVVVEFPSGPRANAA